MREILFKAKRKDWKELPKEQWWVEGYYVYCRKRHYILPVLNKAIGFDEREDEWIEIDPDTLCQYTGLTDKHDNKIWENDILCGRLDEEYPENITYKKVVWDMNGFYTKEDCSTDLDPLDEFDAEYFEVCGNIFDNADLLEVNDEKRTVRT